MHVDPGLMSTQRVLIVEDEYFLASDLQLALEAEGYQALGPFGHLSDQLYEAVAGRPDAAVLDINLQGEMAYEVIDKLRALSVPVILTTGYGRAGLPDHISGCRIIDKPYKVSQIQDELRTVLGQPNNGASVHESGGTDSAG